MGQFGGKNALINNFHHGKAQNFYPTLAHCDTPFILRTEFALWAFMSAVILLRIF